VLEADVVTAGLIGDGHEHEKHVRPHRAVLVQDIEKLEEIQREGYPVGPGVLGENLTVRDLNVQGLPPGTRLHMDNGPLLELTEPRRPCYVMEQIDPRLQVAVAGRCGYLAKVIQPGRIFTGQIITILDEPETAHLAL
jgi:MOSC domain-containing protein YiiM